MHALNFFKTHKMESVLFRTFEAHKEECGKNKGELGFSVAELVSPLSSAPYSDGKEYPVTQVIEETAGSLG